MRSKRNSRCDYDVEMSRVFDTSAAERVCEQAGAAETQIGFAVYLHRQRKGNRRSALSQTPLLTVSTRSVSVKDTIFVIGCGLSAPGLDDVDANSKHQRLPALVTALFSKHDSQVWLYRSLLDSIVFAIDSVTCPSFACMSQRRLALYGPSQPASLK